ncbi:hypothetical protein [Nonomuraea aurantiaca]|nr:hypothetical protein [Nonomuraea aurantiaca]MCA2227806.1 hypothetical protein [Nonomuraea aurantiaca]
MTKLRRYRYANHRLLVFGFAGVSILRMPGAEWSGEPKTAVASVVRA